MKIKKKTQKKIMDASQRTYPNEMCGVLIGGDFIELTNMSKDPQNHFEIDPHALAQVEDQGDIQAYVHSHPDGTAVASALDRHQIELHGKPWVICSYPDVDIQMYHPCGYQSPLIGRNYYHGWQDCYALIRDFYQRELGIELLDFVRDDRWWEIKDHASLYLKNYQRAGFEQVQTPQYGDVFICQVGRTEHPNHALIWLGNQGQLNSEASEPCVGSSLVLHHPYHQASRREVYGQKWHERTVLMLRHKEVKHV